MFEKVKDILSMAKRDAAKFMENQFAQTANITGIAMAIFVLVVIGYVSIYVVNEIHGIAGITSGSVFFTASNKVISVMNTSWGKLRACKNHIQKSVNSQIYEFLNSHNDVNRRYRLCGLKNVYTAGVSGFGGSDNCSHKRRARRQRCWRDITTVTTQRYNNKRGAVPSPTFIFSAQKHTEYL